MPAAYKHKHKVSYNMPIVLQYHNSLGITLTIHYHIFIQLTYIFWFIRACLCTCFSS